MEIQFKKNVRIICDLEIGETVTIKNWGYKLDGEHKILDMKFSPGCESSFLIKVDGYDSWIDSGWVDKISKTEVEKAKID